MEILPRLTLSFVSPPACFRPATFVVFWGLGTLIHGQVQFPEVPEDQDLDLQRWNETIEPVPATPDYAKLNAWSCLPSDLAFFKTKSETTFDAPNPAMALPKGIKSANLTTLTSAENADVFFLHPTMLLEGPTWNADVHDAEMNAEVDKWPIRHQASAFSGAGRVFAPRYRQAHVRVFSLGDSLSWAAAEIAYQDIAAAFRHYLEHWNDGRPIVVAGHSQGAFHGRRLLQEFFDGQDLHTQLVAAYLPGMDMYAHEFDTIDLCRAKDQTGCLCTWMTYSEGFVPPWLKAKQARHDFEQGLCVHPVTWTTAKGVANEIDAHLGVVRPSFRLSRPSAVKGHINDHGTLWIDSPRVLGAKLLRRDNWHSGDINLFWVNIHQNAVLRVQTWRATH